MKALNWNYVYLNNNYNIDGKVSDDEYNAICLRDLESEKNVQVIPDSLVGFPKILKILNKVHYSPRVNRYIKLPLKSVWFSSLYDIKFATDSPICFVIANSRIPLQYLEYLKKNYKKCKIVRVYRDLLSACEINPDYSLETFDQVYDLRFTIDKNESVKYGMEFFHEIESKIDLNCNPPYKYDVFFAGQAKDRLNSLVRAYDILSNSGLKCYFFITHINTKERVKREGIEYANSFMPYLEMLQLTAKSKCLLDINRIGAVGFTSRFLEAVMYDKFLICNNPAVLESKYYTPRYIQYIQDVEQIDPGFLKGKECAHFEYDNDFSPIHLIELIDEKLTSLNK